MAKTVEKDRKAVEPKIKLADLMFYFDAQERDRLDHGRLGRKSGQVLALREKLLKLPSEEFDSTMKSIEALVGVSAATPSPAALDPSHSMQRRDAIELFEKAARTESK